MIYFSIKFTKNMNLYRESSNQEIETKSSEAVVLEKCEDESNTKEHHHMNIIKQRHACVPVILMMSFC